MDETSHGMEQIGSRNDADDLVSFDDWNSLYMVAFH